MATRTIANGGGNWNSTSTWTQGVVPVAGDAVVATATSGQLTVNVSSACASIDLTNYTNTLTMTASLSVTSTVTFVAGMNNIGGTAALICTGTATLTSGGKAVPALTLQGAITYTFADDWTVTGVTTVGTSANNITLNGSNLKCNGNFVVGTTGSVLGTTTIKLIGTMAWSGTGTVNNNLNFDSGANTVTLNGANLAYGTGTMTYVSGTLNAGTSGILIKSSCTLTLGSSAHLNNLTFSLASTITLGDNLFVDGTLTFGNVSCGFLGSFDAQCATLAHSALTGLRTWTLKSSQTLTVTGSITITGVVGTHPLLNASTAGVKAKLTVPVTATQSLIYADATDIDSSLGQKIFTAGGALSNTSNWYNSFPVPGGGLAANPIRGFIG